jgi:hypothetical protein
MMCHNQNPKRFKVEPFENVLVAVYDRINDVIKGRVKSNFLVMSLLIEFEIMASKLFHFNRRNKSNFSMPILL